MPHQMQHLCHLCSAKIDFVNNDFILLVALCLIIQIEFIGTWQKMMHTFDKVRNNCPYKGKNALGNQLKGGKRGTKCWHAVIYSLNTVRLHVQKTSSGLLITSNRLEHHRIPMTWFEHHYEEHMHKRVWDPCICAYVRWKSHLFFLSLPSTCLLLGGSFSPHFFQRFTELINAWRWPYYYHTCRSHVCDSILISSWMKTLKNLSGRMY